jgi:hypothetical protein
VNCAQLLTGKRVVPSGRFLVVSTILAHVSAVSVAAEIKTFYRDVLPILQSSCQECHRPNGANLGGVLAPMSLTSYENTRPWARAIAQQVVNRTMPPWHAAPEHHGVFQGERTLTAEEIDIIASWVRTGAQAGNPEEAPPKQPWPTKRGWQIGKPDLILETPEQYFVEDHIRDQFKRYVTPITEEMLPKPRIIRAVEFQSSSSVVHHITAFPLGGTAPGHEPLAYPKGIGQLLKAGDQVVWSMHYHKEPGPGTGVFDRSRIGVKFYEHDDDVTHLFMGDLLSNRDFVIPAGASSFDVQQTYTFPFDAQIVRYTPHMHVRGKSARYEAFYPNGESEVLLSIPRYDFNWQTVYQYKDLKPVPAGTKVVCTFTYDNSAENPNNPDPSKDITWGPKTFDEMMVGGIGFVGPPRSAATVGGD